MVFIWLAISESIYMSIYVSNVIHSECAHVTRTVASLKANIDGIIHIVKKELFILFFCLPLKHVQCSLPGYNSA